MKEFRYAVGEVVKVEGCYCEIKKRDRRTWREPVYYLGPENTLSKRWWTESEITAGERRHGGSPRVFQRRKAIS